MSADTPWTDAAVVREFSSIAVSLLERFCGQLHRGITDLSEKRYLAAEQANADRRECLTLHLC